jgi:hypothetical protein
VRDSQISTVRLNLFKSQESYELCAPNRLKVYEKPQRSRLPLHHPVRQEESRAHKFAALVTSYKLSVSVNAGSPLWYQRIQNEFWQASNLRS